MKPPKEDCLPYYEYYINLVKQEDIVQALDASKNDVIDLIKSIPAQKADFIYAENKWSTKQVLNHIIDTERIMCYRALRFARGDSQLTLPFDENLYAANANLKHTDLSLLLAEFIAVRKSSILFFQQLSNKELRLKGKTAGGEVSVLAIGFMICGHALHHIHVIKDKYLG